MYRLDTFQKRERDREKEELKLRREMANSDPELRDIRVQQIYKKTYSEMIEASEDRQFFKLQASLLRKKEEEDQELLRLSKKSFTSKNNKSKSNPALTVRFDLSTPTPTPPPLIPESSSISPSPPPLQNNTTPNKNSSIFHPTLTPLPRYSPLSTKSDPPQNEHPLFNSFRPINKEKWLNTGTLDDGRNNNISPNKLKIKSFYKGGGLEDVYRIDLEENRLKDEQEKTEKAAAKTKIENERFREVVLSRLKAKGLLLRGERGVNDSIGVLDGRSLHHTLTICDKTPSHSTITTRPMTASPVFHPGGYNHEEGYGSLVFTNSPSPSSHLETLGGVYNATQVESSGHRKAINPQNSQGLRARLKHLEIQPPLRFNHQSESERISDSIGRNLGGNGSFGDDSLEKPSFIRPGSRLSLSYDSLSSGFTRRSSPSPLLSVDGSVLLRPVTPEKWSNGDDFHRIHVAASNSKSQLNGDLFLDGSKRQDLLHDRGKIANLSINQTKSRVFKAEDMGGKERVYYDQKLDERVAFKPLVHTSKWGEVEE